MGRRTENDKRYLYASTSEEGPQKSKHPPDPSVSKVEVVLKVSHLMERKHDISIAGGGKYLDRRNEEEIGKVGAA